MMALLSANAQKRAFTIEDLYRVKGVSSVSLSPDGNVFFVYFNEKQLSKTF